MIGDPTSTPEGTQLRVCCRVMSFRTMEDTLAVEEEHADDLVNLLADVEKQD
jgi:bacterioferritin (cytochrome b1)